MTHPLDDPHASPCIIVFLLFIAYVGYWVGVMGGLGITAGAHR